MPDILSLEEYRQKVRKGIPCLFEYLTREEFQLAYAVAFVGKSEDYGETFPLADYATPGASDETWEELFRRAIRWLADNGWSFKGLSLDGWEIMGGNPPIQPKNLAYFVQFASGSMPSPVVAIQGAIGLFRGILGLDHEAEVLEDALREIESQRGAYAREKEVM